MAKELIYLQTSELRSQGSFIGKVQELIQIPVNYRTRVSDVYTAMKKEFTERKDGDAGSIALAMFTMDISKLVWASKWFDTIDIIPEADIQLYAIFDLRTI